jgi:hypothetical protein
VEVLISLKNCLILRLVVLSDLTVAKRKADPEGITLKDFYLMLRYYYAIYSFEFLHNLTKYYPFSEIFQDKLFHYRYKVARDLDGKIWLKFKIVFTYIADDDYSFYIFYPPKCIKIEKLQEFLEKENAYASESFQGIVKVVIPKQRD